MGRLDNTSINNTINMNLHEYQAKELLGSYGVPVQRGVVLDDLSKLDESYQKLKDETGTSGVLSKHRFTLVDVVKVVVSSWPRIWKSFTHMHPIF